MKLNSCSCPHVFHGLGDGCGGMKVGTEMSGGVFDVRFEDSLIEYAGIALKLSARDAS
jgi:polygalacturonase